MRQFGKSEGRRNVVYEKTIVCLANSIKHDPGRCVAGRVFDGTHFGEWVRPVSIRPQGEISVQERQCSEGSEPGVLDVLAIQFIGPRPDNHQQENHVIDPDTRWRKVGSLDMTTAARAVETVGGPLWENGHSSAYGTNDRIPEVRAATMTRSLYLVRPEGFVVSVRTERNDRPRTRAQFTLEGHEYRLSITDPTVDGRRPVGEYPMDALVCVSLGEIFEDFGGGRNAYKLVAAVLPL